MEQLDKLMNNINKIGFSFLKIIIIIGIIMVGLGIVTYIKEYDKKYLKGGIIITIFGIVTFIVAKKFIM